MNYCFDIDGVVCSTDDRHLYEEAIPNHIIIKKINELFDAGNNITLFTARGTSSGKEWHDITTNQLKKWGVKHHKLIDKGKPSYDVFVDDKAINIETFYQQDISKYVGFVAGAFDLLHAGHCLYLRDAKMQCSYLIAALQIDPSIDRKHKKRPIQSLSERYIQLASIKYVDKIFTYSSESNLLELLKEIRPDVRIVGSDYINAQITGKEYCKSIYFHPREHSWSTTELRARIKNT